MKLIQWNLSNSTHQGPGKCVGMYRMSEPVYSDTPGYQGNVSECTGCQNLSNPTHQGTREMCRNVHDVKILRFYFS